MKKTRRRTPGRRKPTWAEIDAWWHALREAQELNADYRKQNAHLRQVIRTLLNRVRELGGR